MDRLASDILLVLFAGAASAFVLQYADVRADAATRRWGPRVAVLAVNVDDRERAAALFADAGYAPTLLADDGDTADRYGVHSLPHTVVIDAGGVVRAVTNRPADAIAAVDRLLARP